MKQKFILWSVLAALTYTGASAQVGVGTATPDASAALDVVSTTKGMLIPRMTATERTAITTPAEGLMVYQTTAPIGMWVYSNSQWLRMTTTADGGGSLASGFAANTAGSIIAVVLGGTTIPLADGQNLTSDIQANGSNTLFTVSNTGRYRISYHVGTTASLLMSSRLTINGTGYAPSVISPVTSTNNWNAEVVVNLVAGDVIALQLFGLLGAATLNTGSGATLMIQQL